MLNNKLSSIEFLRFISALAVVFYHYNQLFINFDNNLLETLPFFSALKIFYVYGHYAVEIFFTTSGFIFSHIYLHLRKNVKLKEFFVNRFSRLYPIHFVSLIAVSLIFLLDPDMLNYQGYGFIGETFFIDIYHFFLQLFFVSSWGFEKGFSFNAPSWSISVEIALYILFFLSLKKLSKLGLKLAIFYVILFLIIYKFTHILPVITKAVILFFSGIIIRELKVLKNPNKVFLVGLILFIFSFFGNFKIILFCPGVLIIFDYFEKFIIFSKLKKFLNLLGNLSYSIYMLHFPLFIIFIKLINNNFNFNIYSNKLFFLIFFFLIIIISFISFKFFEDPIKKKIRLIYL